MHAIAQRAAREVTGQFTVTQLSELPAGQYLLSITSYDEGDDTFRYCLEEASPSAGRVGSLPSVFLTILVGECGEPSEFCGRRWVIAQPGF